MSKLLKTLIALFAVITVNAQNLKTPDEYLGYPLGSKFSFHHRVTGYVEYVASQRPNQVKVIPYGTSNEGRPLMIAVVATPENLSKIDEIRTNNLKSISLLDGTPTAKVPAIAWLSYNVHGNEAVSSEAVMKVLYELLNANNATTQGILKNTVVILDPCINPDGRDRYAQWYNRATSQNPDLSPASLQHNEPWPGGRFNHYLFDLNRDWAWQVQSETQQRIKLYNAWMPHLHADFHEMGANSTYYFPPSARPYHENLNTWQREFQTTLGEFNKKYFDQNGWLYYSKENYDLFYPSYGDTYPSYNGAIGMTFEQGGSGRAGISFLREDGDTLTLTDRINHHYSTSIGTLEAISSRADKTVEEFVKFFTNSTKNPVGNYKSYIMKTQGSEQKINALTSLLDKLQIQYGFADKSSSASGFNYQSLKDETFKIETNDLIVSAFQPKGTFTKILFEPKSVLEDSNTYDITAWALPYAYGLKAFASTQQLSGSVKKLANTPQTFSNNAPYSYIVAWKSVEEVKFLAALYKNKIKARVNETPFEIEGQKYPHGTLLITRKGNEHLGAKFDEIVRNEAAKLNIKLQAVSTGMVTSGSDFGASSVNSLSAPKVGFIIGEGISPTAAGEVWHFFDQQIGYPATVIDGGYFSKISLSEFDVLVLPDGNYKSIIKDVDALKSWINNGGKLIALEAANNFFADKEGFGLKTKKDSLPKEENTSKVYANRDRESIMEQIPGAIYKMSLDNTHPLAFGYDDSYYCLVRDVYKFDFLKDGWNVGTLKANSHVVGFAGKKAKSQVENSLLVGVQSMGKGSIVYMADSPLFRGFWYGGKLLFGNAVFMK